MRPLLQIETKLNEISNLLRDNLAKLDKIVVTNIHKGPTTLFSIKTNKEPETFISLGGSCRTAHSLLIPHRQFSLPFDSFGSPTLKDVIDVIEQVNNNCFDYESFFEPSLKIKQSNILSPAWSMIHWIPDLSKIKKGEYDKNKVIETFKRRFDRLMSLSEEPQNFVYLTHRDQHKIKKLSEILEQVERLSLYFKINQFIYVSNIPIANDVTGLTTTQAKDDAVNHKLENPYINPLSIKWKNIGLPNYFKYYYANTSNDDLMLVHLRSLDFYKETGITEQTERINKYIQTLKII